MRPSKNAMRSGVNTMYELDHMLNGEGSRQHHQDLIREAELDRLARKVKANKPEMIVKPVSPVGALLLALANMNWR
jgi:hypothetical protein